MTSRGWREMIEREGARAERQARRREERAHILGAPVQISDADLAEHVVFVDGHPVYLTTMSLGLLRLLAEHAGDIVSHGEIRRFGNWTRVSLAADRESEKVHMSILRARIGPDRIESRRNYGYGLVLDHGILFPIARTLPTAAELAEFRRVAHEIADRGLAPFANAFANIYRGWEHGVTMDT